MADANPIFNSVRALAYVRPFTAEAIMASTGVPLRLAAAQSNPYFQIYEGESTASYFSKVEVRIPLADSGTPDGVLILTPAAGYGCIERASVLTAFGDNAEFSPGDPKGPPDAGGYLTYRFGWGEVRFAFLQKSGKHCLSDIVMDATGK